ncbi:hypothetical protein B0H17DRAFT_1132660 [Mycena rosella]|uniref:Protein kinase domain-containing protein n=1 Tax=Mycena rosella TaxID=1033263 RepID=A0AAD7DMQ9_MYCRO|nr:hypothetical protein B0H17DRAFT_1132660 [Mycena rosella]
MWIDSEWSTLGELEQIWAGLQPWLEEHGYMLRPRYRPGWFLAPGIGPNESETAIPGEGTVLDAIRISDGAQVVLKMVETASPETHISRFLTNEPAAQIYMIPLLDLIPFELHDEFSFMVMPRMRGCHIPAFTTVAEVVEFLHQVLKGLVFLHSKNIAHRFNALQRYMHAKHRNGCIAHDPGGFHFNRPHASADGRHLLRTYTGDDSAPHIIKSRTEAGPMKYYFIDFGLSVHFSSYWMRERVTGDVGRLRRCIPEISETVPYDPFKVDVRLVGEMLRWQFLEDYDGLDFLIPIVRNLRKRLPARRPDARGALALFLDLVSKTSAKEMAGQAVIPL